MQDAQIGLYAMVLSTTLESNKSPRTIDGSTASSCSIGLKPREYAKMIQLGVAAASCKPEAKSKADPHRLRVA